MLIMKFNFVKQLTFGHPARDTGSRPEARLPLGSRASKFGFMRSLASPWKPNFLFKKLFLTLLFLMVVGGGLFYWQTAQGVNRTWDGGGVDGTCGGAGTANNWSCAANWSGDVAPGASDIAIFDGTSTKDATINANISVAGISINAGYTGTITQSSTYTVTVGSSHFVQAAGTFTGGSGKIDINGAFTLSGGTFTSTSGTLEAGYSAGSSVTFFTVSGGTFNHNNGTTNFVQTDACVASLTFTIDVATSLTLYNVLVGVGGCVTDTGMSVASGDTIIVTNNFTHTRDRLFGAWEVQGNYTVASTAEGGDATVTMTGTGSKTYTYTAGSEGGSHLRINNSALSVSANAGTTALKITQFTLLAGTFTAPTGTMTIEPPSSTPLNIFLLSSGTFNHNNGTIVFSPRSNCGGPATFTVDVVTSLTLYNINFNDSGGCAGLTSLTTAGGDTIIAANSFTHTNGYLYGGWQVQGSYTVASTADGGTAGITFTGGNNQTYTDQGGNEPDGDVTINKSSGIVTLASNADWNAASQDLTITSGILSLASYTVATTTLAVSSGGLLLVRGGGDLTLGGTLTNNGAIRMQDGDCGSADTSLIRSSSTGVQRSWNGTGTFSLYDVDVRDMAGSAAITLYSSTSTANNGANWTFSGAACPAQPPAAGLSTGKINLQSGKLNLR